MVADNLVVNAKLSGTGLEPAGWRFVSPREEIAPRRAFVPTENGDGRLVLSANGDPHAFGCWEGAVALEPNGWYRARVSARIRDLAAPQLALFAQVGRHFLVPTGPWAEENQFEQTFQWTGGEADSTMQLYLFGTATGSVEWSAPEVIAVEPPIHRQARVATVRFGKDGAPTLAAQLDRMAAKLEEAGALRADIVCLPEFSQVVGVPEETYGTWADAAESVPDGPSCQLLAAAARRHRMYVLSGLMERRGPHVFNTAVLFDREGRLFGQYDKAHLTLYELQCGISRGHEYPVFDLDFGRIAVHICFDEWFPEVARHLAHQGAEILFLPVLGGEPVTWRTRAMDNGIYFVSSAIIPTSMVISSNGAILAEVEDDGIAYADLNLDHRLTKSYGDPTLGFGLPALVPQMRHRLSDALLDELAHGMRRYQAPPARPSEKDPGPVRAPHP